MAASVPIRSPTSTQTSKDDDLSRICNEMRIWISRATSSPKHINNIDEKSGSSSTSTMAISCSNRSGSYEPVKPVVNEQDEQYKNKGRALTTKTTGLTSFELNNLAVCPTEALKSRILRYDSLREDTSTDKPYIVGQNAPRRLLIDTIRPATAPMTPLGLPQQEHGQSSYSWKVSDICPTDDVDRGELCFLDLHTSQKLGSHSRRSVSKTESLSTAPGQSLDLVDNGADTVYTPVRAWCEANFMSPLITVSERGLRNDSLIHCGIDTDTGGFLPVIDQPRTLQTYAEGPCRDYNDMSWRQGNMTSELHIKRELKSRQNIANSLRMTLDKDEHPSHAQDIEWPEAECVVRPATISDLSQIVNIIKLEATSTTDPQFFGSDMTTGKEVQKLFTSCVTSGRPFIVVTPPAETELLDQSKWPENSGKAYKQFVQYMESNPRPPPPVAGFAFLTDYGKGILKSTSLISRYSGQVKLVVHPEHRRKMYGSALLDRIIQSISPFHRTLLDYTWDCKNPNGIYEFPVSRNSRQYTQVYLEMYCAPRKVRQTCWKVDFLEKFDFHKVGLLQNAAVNTDDQHRETFFTMVLWECTILPVSKIVSQPHVY